MRVKRTARENKFLCNCCAAVFGFVGLIAFDLITFCPFHVEKTVLAKEPLALPIIGFCTTAMIDIFKLNNEKTKEIALPAYNANTFFFMSQSDLTRTQHNENRTEQYKVKTKK